MSPAALLAARAESAEDAAAAQRYAAMTGQHLTAEERLAALDASTANYGRPLRTVRLPG